MTLPDFSDPETGRYTHITSPLPVIFTILLVFLLFFFGVFFVLLYIPCHFCSDIALLPVFSVTHNDTTSELKNYEMIFWIWFQAVQQWPDWPLYSLVNFTRFCFLSSVLSIRFLVFPLWLWTSLSHLPIHHVCHLLTFILPFNPCLHFPGFSSLINQKPVLPPSSSFLPQFPSSSCCTYQDQESFFLQPRHSAPVLFQQ